jgi:ABC-2 type transport system ATP-binding protein
MPAAIEAIKLRKEFRSGKVTALDELTLTIEKGEVFGIIGPNGAGKTTFMSCLLGLLYPTSGSLLIDGMPPDAMEIHRKLGHLPERLDFIKWMTAKELMEFHAELLGLPRQQASIEIARLLRLVELEQGAWSRKIKTFSRGMLQRIGMAQALLGAPLFVLLDEPSSGLDPVGVKLFRKILKDLKDSGVTIVINSHQLDQLEKVCDRVAFIKAGKVETIEVMKLPVIKAETIILRWTADREAEFAVDILKNVISTVGGELESFSFPEALVKVDGDGMSTRLIFELGAAGLPVAQASPSEGRLESFFNE